MSGHKRYRNGAWRLTVDAGRDALGKRVQLHRTIHAPDNRAGRKQADLALAALSLEAAERTERRGDDSTVAAYLEDWMARRAPEWAPSTRNTRPGMIRRHVIAHIGHLRLSELRRRDIAALHAKMGETLSATSVGNVHRVLHKALNDAVTLELIDVNPATNVRPPKPQKPKLRAPTDAELDAILAAVADPQLLTVLRLDCVTGSRRGEVVALRWPDIDFDAGTVKIARAISRGPKGEGLVERQTKTGAIHPKALDAGTMAELRAHRARRLEQAMACGARMDERGFVFATDVVGREPMNPERVSRGFAAARKRAGVEGVRLHDIRRYVASQLLHAGLDVQTVAEWLGHSAKMTLDVYGSFIPTEDRRAAEVLARRRGSAS